MTELVVHPHFRLPYYTYVLFGMLRHPEVTALRFRDLGIAPANSMAARLGERRIVVSADDMTDLEPAMVAWATTYGKVNVALNEDATEVIPLGPIFGVRLWSLPQAYLISARLALAGARPADVIRGARFQALARLPVDAYVPGKSSQDYFFFRSRRWTDKHQQANGPRERFLAAMQRLGLTVDGGLADDRISLAEYLDRTRRSAIVFNSPAVHRCLGWKLGEFLALGKAIISTPVQRRLPVPLLHGEHVHFVQDNIDAIADGVRAVLDDLDYRMHLERGARAWFEQHIAPDAVAARLII